MPRYHYYYYYYYYHSSYIFWTVTPICVPRGLHASSVRGTLVVRFHGDVGTARLRYLPPFWESSHGPELECDNLTLFHRQGIQAQVGHNNSHIA